MRCCGHMHSHRLFKRGALKLRLASHQALHVTSYYYIDGYSVNINFVQLLLSDSDYIDCGLIDCKP